MAEQPEIKIKTAFGEISAGGGIVFIVIALAGLTAMAAYEHYKRFHEHVHILCGIRLNAYLQTLPKGEEITWKEIPAEYWDCLPPTVINRQKQQ
jgi:hypothetical protein